LGAECSEGRLHLNEHSIKFELEPIPETRAHRLIITDLRRHSQPIVRLRSDDYIELDPRTAPCPCGYGGRVILPPQGRISDIWRFADRSIVPSQVVAKVEEHLDGGVQWQAVAKPEIVALHVAPDAPMPLSEGARDALAALTGRTVTLHSDLQEWSGPKRRKVVWSDG